MSSRRRFPAQGEDQSRADAQATAAVASAPQAIRSELEQGIALLQGWASAAGDKMASASRHLDAAASRPAAADQQAAIDELEKIWDAVIPFHPLLARDLADQTQIAQSLAPAPLPSRIEAR